jgi:hypothetical protein
MVHIFWKVSLFHQSGDIHVQTAVVVDVNRKSLSLVKPFSNQHCSHHVLSSEIFYHDVCCVRASTFGEEA